MAVSTSTIIGAKAMLTAGVNAGKIEIGQHIHCCLKKTPGLVNMDNRYLLYKFCKDGDRHLITWLTAAGMEEANLAVKLLRKNHPHTPDLILGEGEFFEIIDENRVEPGEWEQAMKTLSLRKDGLHSMVTQKENSD